jgi:hypothetical protein
MSNVVKFPFSVSRRAHARKPRKSINGTPEERGAKFVPSKKSESCGHSNPLRAKIVTVSRAATIAGRVNYQSRDLSRIGPLGERHSQELRRAAEEARYLASEFERAAEHLVQPREMTVTAMTTEEFGETYLQAPPEIQQFISGKMRDMIEKRSAELET